MACSSSANFLPYPAGLNSLEGATSFLGGLTPDVEVAWNVDYELAQ